MSSSIDDSHPARTDPRENLVLPDAFGTDTKLDRRRGESID